MLPFQMGRIWAMLSHSSAPLNLKPPSAESSSRSLKSLATRGNGLMLPVEMSLLASFMNLAGPDLIVILLIILVLFGAKKLPELARGMGQAVREFQKAKDEFSDELHKAGTNDVAKNQPDVRAPAATVPRIENSGSVTQPDPAASTTEPGRQADDIRSGR